MASLRAAPLPRAISSPSRRAAGARRARPCASAAGAAAAEAKTVASSAHSDAELLALLEGTGACTRASRGTPEDGHTRSGCARVALLRAQRRAGVTALWVGRAYFCAWAGRHWPHRCAPARRVACAGGGEELLRVCG